MPRPDHGAAFSLLSSTPPHSPRPSLFQSHLWTDGAPSLKSGQKSPVKRVRVASPRADGKGSKAVREEKERRDVDEEKRINLKPSIHNLEDPEPNQVKYMRVKRRRG